jgi:hypothetical protein
MMMMMMMRRRRRRRTMMMMMMMMMTMTMMMMMMMPRRPHFGLEGHDKGVNCLDYYPGGDKVRRNDLVLHTQSVPPWPLAPHTKGDAVQAFIPHLQPMLNALSE